MGVTRKDGGVLEFITSVWQLLWGLFLSQAPGHAKHTAPPAVDQGQF